MLDNDWWVTRDGEEDITAMFESRAHLLPHEDIMELMYGKTEFCIPWHLFVLCPCVY